MEIGLFALRIVVGLLLAGHGAQKLFGWFGGHGLVGTGGFFESLGYRPGRPMALLGGLGEFVGGLYLAFGFLTPLGAAAVIGVMVNAIVAVHLGKGPWATNGGWELPLTNATVAGALAFTGPGRWSLDHAFDWNLAGNGWGFAAVVGGLVAAAGALYVRTTGRVLAQDERASAGAERAAWTTSSSARPEVPAGGDERRSV